MAALCSSETEDFVTCPICFCEFDSEDGKPKFLPCSHTVCLTCLKEIHKNSKITCPLCRKVCIQEDDANSLPNNSYALHILKLKTRTPPTLMSTIKEFEDLLSLKEELKEMKDRGRAKLSKAIDKRSKVDQHLKEILGNLKETEKEIQSLREHNDHLRLEMTIQMEEKEKVEKNPSSLSELISLVGDSEPEDTLDVLKEKMRKSVAGCEAHLEEATSLASKYTLQKTTQLTVLLSSEDQQPQTLITSGKDTPLISYLVSYELLKRKKSQPCVPVTPGLLDLSMPTISSNKEGRTISSDKQKNTNNKEAAPFFGSQSSIRDSPTSSGNILNQNPNQHPGTGGALSAQTSLNWRKRVQPNRGSIDRVPVNSPDSQRDYTPHGPKWIAFLSEQRTRKQ